MSDIVRTETWEKAGRQCLVLVGRGETAMVSIPLMHQMLTDLGFKIVDSTRGAS
jgi:hypothetical protein